MDISLTEKKLLSARRSCNRILSKKEVIKEDIGNIERRLESLYRERDDAVEARRIVVEIAKLTMTRISGYLKSLVTSSLQSVYPDSGYKFLAEFDSKEGKKSELLMTVQKRDKEPYHPKEEQAGGILDVIGISLVISLWGAMKKSYRRLLILDEPFTSLGSLVGLMGNVLAEVSKRLGLQIILVTHEDELAETADRSWMVVRGGEDRSIVSQFDLAVSQDSKGAPHRKRLRRRRCEQPKTETPD